MGQVVRLRALLDELSSEHRQLMSALAEVEAAVSVPGFRPRLLRLQRTLILHFGHEQLSDGLYDTLALWESSDAEVLEELIDEHRRILVMVDALLASTDTGAPALDAAQRAELSCLTQLIHAHERRESRLIRDALEEDPSATATD